MQEEPNIEFEQDWTVGLGATLVADIKLKKIFFYLEGFFREQPIVPYSWGWNVQLKIRGATAPKSQDRLKWLLPEGSTGSTQPREDNWVAT